MSDYSDVWYKSDDGLRLYARDYQNAEAALTILCMHGLTRNSADFEDVSSALQQSYRVVSVDQRGRGRSDWDTRVSNYTPACYVEDMFTLIDEMKLNNLVLVGTSMGGLMSMMMNAMNPGFFKAVVLNDIGPVVAEKGLERIKGYLGKDKPVETWDDAVEQTADANAVAFPNYHRDDWSKWVSRMYEENAEGKLVLRYDPAISEPMNKDQDTAVPPDLWPLFDAMIEVPLLTFHGELSDILEADCVEEMLRRHSTMQLVEVQGVGHAPMLDEPEVMPALSAFLSGLT